MNWLPLITEEQLTQINSLSQQKDIAAVVIFKHSTRCSISSMALNRLERSWNLHEQSVPAYYLDLLNYRGISNKIEKLYGITHQSPQILVIKNEKCIYSVSHSEISAAAIAAVFNS
jgi:bacillithiol system protein YtxJ